MTATNPRDRETVRTILRQTLPSGFPQPLTPLTIGAVACRIHNEWQSGRLQILRTDKAMNDQIMGNTTPLPADLNEQSIRDLLAAAGGMEAPGALAPYWALFLEVAQGLILERGRNFRLPHPRAF